MKQALTTLPAFCLAGVLGLTAAAPAPTAGAQAYCALRDPVTQIYKVCPAAKSYRSVVRTVDESARDAVTARVPYPMHFTELGRHTLYVGLDGQRPVGLVQARSERSRRGLVEVVWAFDLDLRVTGFALQRCRAKSADRKAVASGAFTSLVAGRSFGELVQLLSTDGKSLAPEARAVISGNPDLAVVVLRCGIKTLAATEAVWADDVVASRLWHHALGHFPGADNLLAVAEPYGPEVLQQLAGDSALDGSVVQRSDVRMYLAQKAGSTQGALVRTGCRFGKDAVTVWWGVGADGKISGAKSLGGADPLTAEALSALTGHDLNALDADASCSGPLKMVATEVLVSAVAQMGGE